MIVRLLPLILVAGLVARAACADPFPLGGHAAGYWQGHPGPYHRIDAFRGFDPTLHPEDACAKAALIRGLQTFPVGLPNGAEPADLANRWSHGSQVLPSELAGLP